MKKVLWTLPVLGIGIAIGGLAFPRVFAAGSSQANPTPSQAQVQQALNSPQGQAMIQACESFMGQVSRPQR